MDYTNFLIHKILHDGEEIDMSFLIESSVVETIDLSGPRIMLKFNDQFSLIRDERRVKPGDLLKITLPMGNEAGTSEQGSMKNAFYRILTMPVTAKEEVIINCIEDDIWQWKQPIVDARIFKNMDPLTIVMEMDPKYPNRANILFDSLDEYLVTEDYHFLPGERTTLTLRQMCREHAMCVYISRGALCIRKIRRLVETGSDPRATDIQFTYDYYDEAFPDDVEFNEHHGAITMYSVPYGDKILEDMMVRYYTGWNMIDGRFDATRNTDQPIKFVGPKYQTTINNYNTVLVPAVEFMAPGNAVLGAGATMKLNWYQSDKEHPIDESLPPKALVHTVAHYYSAQKYFMRVKLVNLAEWCEA